MYFYFIGEDKYGLFKKYFKKANKEMLMGEDYQAYKNLPDKITVYRGVYQKATTRHDI